MERRNRNILVICIAAVIVVAVFSSFGLNLFAGSTPHIVLPTPSASGAPGGTSQDNPGGSPVRVEVTPDTVQHIIAVLSRPESYYREVTVEDFWGEGASSRTTAKVWVEDGWTRVEATGPAGTVRNSLVGDGAFWIWYGNETETLTGPADAYSADLEGQRIPTYEDVLSLDKSLITGTGYEEKGGLPCIYVEVAQNDPDYLERYWVAVDTGLLVAAETTQGDELLYRMSSGSFERPAPAGSLPSSGWTLPGTESPS